VPFSSQKAATTKQAATKTTVRQNTISRVSRWGAGDMPPAWTNPLAASRCAANHCEDSTEELLTFLGHCFALAQGDARQSGAMDQPPRQATGVSTCQNGGVSRIRQEPQASFQPS
jgi:hypothetical protein